MTAKKKQADAETNRLWVRAKVVSEVLDVSLSAIYQGQCGCDRLRSARIPGAGKKRQARRWLWADVLAMHNEMMKQTEKDESIPENILRLMGGAGRRRR
jgi:hypothetical protein